MIKLIIYIELVLIELRKIASDINTYKKHELLDKASQGEYHTIYISPERLQIKSFQKLWKLLQEIYTFHFLL